MSNRHQLATALPAQTRELVSLLLLVLISIPLRGGSVI